MIYKVTTKENKSAVVDDPFAIQYSTEQFASAPKVMADQGYHITAFDDKDQTRIFCDSMPDLVLWEAEAEGIIEHMPNRMLYQGGIPAFDESEVSLWPFGTIMCEKLKLVKIAPRYE